MVNLNPLPDLLNEAPANDVTCETRSSEPEANPAGSIVYIVDDDTGICEAFRSLFESTGLRARTFTSGEAFLASDMPDVPSCLLLDVRLRGLGGFAMQSKMRAQGIAVPVIFITGHGDVAMSVRAMKAGAFDFLVKPCREQTLIEAVQGALDLDEKRIQSRRSLQGLVSLYDSLSTRQREVMNLLVQGLSTREIASRLNLCIDTVKLNRKDLMIKMEAPTLVHLVRIVIRMARGQAVQGDG
ncbi:response regulator transcription factor [Paraburkholderia jirisanensis]